MADKLLLVRIDVAEAGADDDRLDLLADRLRGTLREAVPGTVTVRPPAGEAPPGTRGTLETVGAVLVTVQASVELLRVIHAGVREWLSRTPAAEASSSLRVQVGDAKVDIAEVTPEQQERLITEILRILAEDDDRD